MQWGIYCRNKRSRKITGQLITMANIQKVIIILDIILTIINSTDLKMKLWYNCLKKDWGFFRMTDTRDNGISFIRVVSMFIIIATHFITEIDSISFMGQITNAAVNTFLLISAYLFSKKDILKPSQWLGKRLKRILIPFYVYLIVFFLYKVIVGQFEISVFLIYSFNLQGVLGKTEGIGHLWFITTIMFCYLITPLLDKYKDRFINNTKTQRTLAIAALLTIWIMITYLVNVTIGIIVGYLVFFTICYLLSLVVNINISNKGFLLLTSITFLAQVARLLFRMTMEGTLTYNVIVFCISNGILGVFLFIVLYKFNKVYNSQLVQKVVNYFDNISYEMYITHYAFIVGPFTIWGISDSLLVNILLVLAATYLSAVLLNKASNYILSDSGTKLLTN